MKKVPVITLIVFILVCIFTCANAVVFTFDEVKQAFDSNRFYIKDCSDQDLMAIKVLIDIESYERGLPEAIINADGTIVFDDEFVNKIQGSSDTTKSIKDRWFDYGLGQYLPNPVSVLNKECNSSNRLHFNSDSSFIESIDDLEVDDFHKYIEEVKNWGFDEDIVFSRGVYYSAEKESKYKITITFTDLTDANLNLKYKTQMLISIDIVS